MQRVLELKRSLKSKLRHLIVATHVIHFIFEKNMTREVK